MLQILSSLPDEAINFSAWNPDWTVGKVAHHIVMAQGLLISRVRDSENPPVFAPTTTSAGISELMLLCKERDSQLLSLIDTPDEIRKFSRLGKEVEFHTSTILVQAVHHASEHRAQISDILATNKMDVLNLDRIDVWSYERWQRAQLQ